MALFDRGVAEVLENFDAEQGLVRHTIPEGAPGVSPGVAQLDRFTRLKYISPGFVDILACDVVLSVRACPRSGLKPPDFSLTLRMTPIKPSC